MGSGGRVERAKAGNYQKDISGFFHFFCLRVNTVKSKANLVSLCPQFSAHT